MSVIDKVKRSLGILLTDESQDDLFNILVEDATEDLLSWINRVTLPTTLESVLRQIVIIRYNKMGIEGETGHSEGGISRTFEDLSPSLKSTIANHRILKVAGRR
ncbi:phage head-tail connector protein [Paenibacillus sp. FSL H3-0333]|uniref:phage head-tail connector protein n=1 Tax=Paenibacillus sp. FSL H3-0333 TaxID=2921373 RepID=UPI0030F66739